MGEGVVFTHVKAHRAKKVIEKLGAEDKHRAQGNTKADTWAKEGADMDVTKPGGQLARAQAHEKAAWALRHVAKFTKSVVRQGMWVDRDPFPLKARSPFWRKLPVPPARPHAWAWQTNRSAMTCLQCGRFARTRSLQLALRRQECPGATSTMARLAGRERCAG